jgi:hypothetical protein
MEALLGASIWAVFPLSKKKLSFPDTQDFQEKVISLTSE